MTNQTVAVGRRETSKRNRNAIRRDKATRSRSDAIAAKRLKRSPTRARLSPFRQNATVTRTVALQARGDSSRSPVEVSIPRLRANRHAQSVPTSRSRGCEHRQACAWKEADYVSTFRGSRSRVGPRRWAAVGWDGLRYVRALAFARLGSPGDEKARKGAMALPFSASRKDVLGRAAVGVVDVLHNVGDDARPLSREAAHDWPLLWHVAVYPEVGAPTCMATLMGESWRNAH